MLDKWYCACYLQCKESDRANLGITTLTPSGCHSLQATEMVLWNVFSMVALLIILTVGLDLFTPSALALHPRELRSFHPENNLIL